MPLPSFYAHTFTLQSAAERDSIPVYLCAPFFSPLAAGVIHGNDVLRSSFVLVQYVRSRRCNA